MKLPGFILFSFTFLSPHLAHAGQIGFDGIALLNQYNLIVEGDVNSVSEIDGNALIGGDVYGGLYNMHVTPNEVAPALTVAGDLYDSVQTKGTGTYVGGSVSGTLIANDGGEVVVGSVSGSLTNNANGSGTTYIVGDVSGQARTNGGDTIYGGTNSGTVDANGGGTVINQPVTPPFSADDTVQDAIDTLSELSVFLADINANSQYSFMGNRVVFDATPDDKGLAVFQIDDAKSFFSSSSEFEFLLNGATSVLFNVFDNNYADYDIGSNFLAGSAVSYGDSLLWNFVDADSLIIDAQFGGSILALGADVTNNQNIEGTLVAGSLFQNAEIHSQPTVFKKPETETSEVPTPPALFLFLPVMLFTLLRNRS